MGSEQPSSVRVFVAPDHRVLPSDVTTLRLVARIIAAVAGLIAAVALIGWALDVPALERIGPGLPTMKVDTCLSLILLAAGLLLPRGAGAIATGVAGAIAAAQLLEYATGTNFGIDQLLRADSSHSAHPGRSSVAVAACLLVLALARLPGIVSQRRPSQMLALVDLTLAGLALLGFLYRHTSMYSLEPFSTLTVPTALALALLGLATMAMTEDGALEWVVAGRDAGATLLRTLLPLTVAGLPLIGYLCLGADRLGWVSGTETVLLVVVLCTLVIGTFTWISARRLSRVDAHRVNALHNLTDLTNNLERQVLERSAQARLRRDDIAVLEDRQRIAADLHDIVIQRLFAAGMFLHGATRSDPDTIRRIDTAIESMDIAIKDLRASIFELGGHGSRLVDLETAFDEVCTDAARVLGFAPDMTVDDPDQEAEAVRDDLLAVLREALSNVARHAHASKVDVVLRTGTGLISLTVTDDGQGMTETPHSSGTGNIAARARQNGGDCVWTTVHPHGTRVWWHVPGAPAVIGTSEPNEDEPNEPRPLPAEAALAHAVVTQRP